MNKQTVTTDEGPLKLRLGATIRHFRHDRGWSQEQLAERAGMHRTYIADAERGVRNMSLSSIARLTEAMEVALPKFFGALEKQKVAPVPKRRAAKAKPAAKAARKPARKRR